MKSISVLLLSCLVFTTTTAQQLPLFTQYREFSGILNPAAVPNDYLWYEMPISVGVSYRRQWINDKDGPHTELLRGDYMIEREGVSILPGLYIINDQAARMGMTGVYGRFAGILSNGNPLEQGLAFGLNVGVVRYGLDLSNANNTDPNDISLYDIDNETFADAGVGVYAYTTLGNSNLLYGGLSSPQVLGLDVRFRDSNHDLSVQRQRHYYATAGYKMALLSEEGFLDFSTWVKYIPPLGPHLDFNVRYQMSPEFNLGAGLSTSGYFHAEVGFKFGEERLYRFGYALDAPFTETSSYYGYSHEFNLVIAFQH